MTYKWRNKDLRRRHSRWDAGLTRDYINGVRGLSVAFRWARTPMGFDYWDQFRGTKYADLPDEARAYVDAVAALYLDDGNDSSEASYDFRAEVFALIEAFGPDCGSESLSLILRDIADELAEKKE